MAKRKKRKLKKSGILLIILLILIPLFLLNKDDKANFKTNFQNIYDKVIKNTKKYKKCINDSKSFMEDDFSDDLKNDKENLKRIFDTTANFTYYDLMTDYKFGKGEDSLTYAASVNKLPAVLYAYHLADQGKLDLNQKLTYTSKYSHGGSGIIQNDPVGTKYTISKLLENAIRYSDNIAYFMILDQIGDTVKVKEYFKSLDIDITYTDKFGNLSPDLGVQYLKEVYKYYKSGMENAKKLYGDMIVSDNLDFIKNDGAEYDLAHKYGWYSNYYNDISLVMTDEPYILAITSTKGFNDNTKNFFLKAHSLADKFHEDYYKEKEDYCLSKI